MASKLDRIVFRGASHTVTVCYRYNTTNEKAFWQNENPLIQSLPHLTIHLSITILCIRLLFFVLKPLRQPRFLAELLSCVFLGQTYFIYTPFSVKYVVNVRFTRIVDAVGQLGLVYYMFLVGLEMDLTALKHIKKNAVFNAAITVIFSLVFGIGLYLFLMYFKDIRLIGMGGALWAITLTVTSFSDLAKILSDLKLLHTELGRLALSSAIVCDLVAWTLLVVTITIVNQNLYYLNVFAMIIFVLLCWFAVRPGISRLILHNKPNGDNDYELLSYFILGSVVIFGLITDACGSQSMIGAFMFGLSIPKGELAMSLIEKLEDLVTGVLLPGFFWITGMKINLFDLINGTVNPVVVFIVIVLASMTKIIGAFIFSILQGMSSREGIALGVLMNTKGVLALIIMSTGRELSGFDQQLFSIMIAALILMTLMVKPVAMATTKSIMQVKKRKHKTIEKSNQDSEFHIISCVHSVSNLSGIINLLQYSNPTKKSPIYVFAVHLLQLTTRSVSEMLIVYDTYNSSPARGQDKENHEVDEESEKIINAFKSYESKSNPVYVQLLTIVSPYTSMHEDVIRLAEDNRANLILIPFHQKADVYGKLQDDEDSSLKAVMNRNLVANSPCSLGILVDRGLGDSEKKTHFVMLFIGGADSREALAYAWRIAGTKEVMLTVVRFVPGTTTLDDELRSETEHDTERKLDDEYIDDFRFETIYDESIIYVEIPVGSGDEILTTMRKMHEDYEYDMYIVGRGQGSIPELTLGLVEWSDCEDLGALGDALLSSDFSEQSSLLVIQQHYIPATHEVNKNNHNRKSHLNHYQVTWM